MNTMTTAAPPGAASTPSAPRLEYATPVVRPARAGYALLTGSVAVAAGLLLANAFADAAGLSSEPAELGVLLRVACGLVVAVVVGAFLDTMIRLARRAAEALRGRRHVADRPASVALLCCGTLCILGTLALEAVVLTYGPSHEVILGANPGPALIAQVLIVLTLVIGAALVATGVWALLADGTKDVAATRGE